MLTATDVRTSKTAKLKKKLFYVELAGLPAPPTSLTLRLPLPPFLYLPIPDYTAGNLEIPPDLS